METLTDVWELESEEQEHAINDLNSIVEYAMTFKGTGARNYLKKLWPHESWQRIKAKLNTEGSCWYVWWLDGVNTHLNNLQSGKVKIKDGKIK